MPRWTGVGRAATHGAFGFAFTTEGHDPGSVNIRYA